MKSPLTDGSRMAEVDLLGLAENKRNIEAERGETQPGDSSNTESISTGREYGYGGYRWTAVAPVA
jgi:hypothetical protein